MTWPLQLFLHILEARVRDFIEEFYGMLTRVWVDFVLHSLSVRERSLEIYLLWKVLVTICASDCKKRINVQVRHLFYKMRLIIVCLCNTMGANGRFHVITVRYLTVHAYLLVM